MRTILKPCLSLLTALLAAAMLVGGCGMIGFSKSDPVSPVRNRPRTFLAGAEVPQARSLAMGSAVVKGWKIVDTAGNRLLIERPLDIAVAERIVGKRPVTTAAVAVRTDFNARWMGVDVTADAAIIAIQVTEPGERSAIEIDLTDFYWDELNDSLTALQRSWEKNRQRIAAAVRPVPTRTASPEDKAIASGKIDTTAPIFEKAPTGTVTGGRTDTGVTPLSQTTTGDHEKSHPYDFSWPNMKTWLSLGSIFQAPVCSKNSRAPSSCTGTLNSSRHPTTAPDVAASTDDHTVPIEERSISALPTPLMAVPANNLPVLDRMEQPDT